MGSAGCGRMRTPAMKVLPLLAAALLLAGLCAGCGSAPASGAAAPADSEPAVSLPPADDNADWQSTITFNGVNYRRRRDLKTVLFLGVDNANLTESVGEIAGNNGRADAIMLFLLDTGTKTMQTLAISRDTITDVDVYRGNGDYAYTGPMHITLQYIYGDSDRRSCFLMERTVSRLLYNVPITGSLALKMDGIPLIVEELGGITLTFPEDYSYIDPAYVSGAQVTLDGPATEKFVRSRDITVTGSAEQRLARETWFMHELFSQLKAKGGMAETLQHMLTVAGDSIETNLDAETLQMLAEYDLQEETLKVPGATVAGAVHDEYHVDEEALQQMIIELFYEPETAAP